MKKYLGFVVALLLPFSGFAGHHEESEPAIQYVLTQGIKADNDTEGQRIVQVSRRPTNFNCILKIGIILFSQKVPDAETFSVEKSAGLHVDVTLSWNLHWHGSFAAWMFEASSHKCSSRWRV